jgi:hypothetical protein
MYGIKPYIAIVFQSFWQDIEHSPRGNKRGSRFICHAPGDVAQAITLALMIGADHD